MIKTTQVVFFCPYFTIDPINEIKSTNPVGESNL